MDKTHKINKIRKRDGRIVEFAQEKITNAILKAAKSVGGHDRKTAEELSNRVVTILEYKFDHGEVPTVEEIQDIVEKVLIKSGHAKTAKAYILHRQQRKKIREAKDMVIDVNNTISSYLDQVDWRVKENSNEDYSFSGLMLYTAGKVIANYALNHIYTSEISDAHKKGYFHIHDLSHAFIGYCAGWSLKKLLEKGFGNVANKVDARPAKHMDVVVHQMVNFIGCLQMEFAGAQAFSSVDTLLAPFVKTDNLTYKQTKQCMQELVYSLNIPSRWGSQYPFSNLTFDWIAPEDLKNEKAIVGGKKQDFTYGDCQKEMDMINKAFLEVMMEGDANGRIFTFPIPTYNLTKDFDWDSENAKILFELTAKYGSPYFQNYIGSNLDPRSIRAMCLLAGEEIIVKIDDKIKRLTIQELCETYSHGFDKCGWGENKEDIYAISIDKNFKTKWVRIKRFLKIKGNTVTTIKTRDGKFIRVSPDHPIPVITKEGIAIKLANALSNEDYMLTLKNTTGIASNNYKKIGKHEVNEKFAKLLGLFISEGNFLYDSRKPYKNFDSLKGIQFSLNYYEQELIEELINVLKDILKKDPKIRKDPRFNTITIIAYSKEFAQLLFANGVHKYGNLPDFIFDSPKTVIRVFLEYHFLGDGYKNGKEIHINDEKLSRDLVTLYSVVGIPTTYRERKNSQVIRIQHSSGRGSKNKVKRGILYNRVPNYLVGDDVHGARRSMFSNKYETISLNSLETFGGLTQLNKKLLMNDVAVIRISSIEHNIKKEPQVFYDVELEGEHLFAHSLGAITHNCCRLNLDQTQLIKRPGGMWSMGESTGSLGVVTINMNRMGYEAKTKEEFFEKLGHYMGLAKESLEIKREIVEGNLKNGLMPYTKAYLGSFRNHFSTIGLCGMNECCLNFLGKNIRSKEGKAFTIETLNFMRDKLVEFQEETGSLYNLEATPAESTSYRLARIDKEMYPDIITAGKNEPYLTNSSQLAVNETDDAIEAIEHQNEIQPLYTGGTIFHTFLGEKVSSAEPCKKLVRKIAENTRLPYFSITPTFSICKKHGYIKGEHPKCPTCNEETEVYSRIVGYFRPIKNWNNGKKEEFKDRLEYVEGKLLAGSFKPIETIKTNESIEEPEILMNKGATRYKIFTLPGCGKCESAKEFLINSPIEGEVFDMGVKEGLKIFREYYKQLKGTIKRNEDGSLPVPTILFFDEDDKIVGIANKVEELERFV